LYQAKREYRNKRDNERNNDIVHVDRGPNRSLPLATPATRWTGEWLVRRNSIPSTSKNTIRVYSGSARDARLSGPAGRSNRGTSRTGLTRPRAIALSRAAGPTSMMSTEPPVDAMHRRRKRPRSFGWLDDKVDVAVLWGLPPIVVGSVLAVGTVHVPVLLVVAGFALPLGALAVWSETRRGHRPPLAVIVLTGLAGFSLLQALPVPFRWLQSIAPSSASVWRDARQLLGDPVQRWASISLDPRASVVEGLKWLTYAAVIAAAVRFGQRRGTAAGPLVVFVAATIAAIITILHGAAGAERLYGIYEPTIPRGRWGMSPLLNPNNFSGYLNLGIFCGMGLLVAPRPQLPRPAVGIALSTLVAVSAIAASRGALGALGLGFVTLIPVLAWLNRRSAHTHEPGFWAGPAPVSAVALGGVLLAILGGGRDKWDSLIHESLVKLTVIARTLPMIRKHWLLGSGRGSFETVFPAYATGSGNTIYQHAENFVAQWLAEWGVPVAGAGLILLCYAFHPRRLRAHRSKLTACSVVGVYALLFQNLFDLALEIPSVCIALGTLLGGLLGAASDHAQRRPIAAGPLVWARVWALVPIAGLVLVPLAGAFSRTLALKERADLHLLLVNETAHALSPSPGFWDALRAAVRRHPADPYLALIGATAARYDPKHHPLPWVGWSIERGPTRGAPYVLLAKILLGRGITDQALHALSLAAATGEGLDVVAKVALLATQRPDEIERAVPAGRVGAPMWLAIARQLGEHAPATLRVDVLRRAVARDGRYPPALVALAAALQDAVERGSAPCDGVARETCLSESSPLLWSLTRAPPPDQGAILLRARWLAARGKPSEAYQWLARQCAEALDRPACERKRVALAYELGNGSETAASVDEYLQVACSLSSGCASAASWAGDLAASHDQWTHAVEYYERAAHAAPSTKAWLKVADAANRAGLFARAVHATQRADVERRRAPGPGSVP
jgi:hypothetical protein